jgi:hypothetical protein
LAIKKFERNRLKSNGFWRVLNFYEISIFNDSRQVVVVDAWIGDSARSGRVFQSVEFLASQPSAT